jgi:hypothetical protein
MSRGGVRRAARSSSRGGKRFWTRASRHRTTLVSAFISSTPVCARPPGRQDRLPLRLDDVSRDHELRRPVGRCARITDERCAVRSVTAASLAQQATRDMRTRPQGRMCGLGLGAGVRNQIGALSLPARRPAEAKRRPKGGRSPPCGEPDVRGTPAYTHAHGHTTLPLLRLPRAYVKCNRCTASHETGDA